MPAKSRAFDRAIEHPKVLELLNNILLPNYLLSAAQAINILPGETRQPFHTDDGSIFFQKTKKKKKLFLFFSIRFMNVPRPHQPFSVATIWALTGKNLSKIY